MEQTTDLLQLIEEKSARMSKGHRAISRFILQEYDKAAFMTALKIGERVGVSESTVVRFAMSLGFSGYPELQKALQELVRNKLTTLQRMEMTSDQSYSMVLRGVMKADINNLKSTLENLSADTFEAMVEAMYSAKRVYIMGLRSSAPLAQFMGYYLSFILDNVCVVTSGINDILEQIFHIEQGDMLLGISFPRYSRRTVDGMRYARERGATVAAVTDSATSPLASLAKHTLMVKSDIASFVDSLVAPFSVMNALIVAIAMKKRTAVADHFKTLEDIWGQYHVYLEKENG